MKRRTTTLTKLAHSQLDPSKLTAVVGGPGGLVSTSMTRFPCDGPGRGGTCD
jgi:hypothetical protein